MEWIDSGIVLGVRRHGEANAIAELMTRAHGRHLGLVRGGAGSRLRPVLQPGNSVRAVWRARLDEHLGHFVVEGLELRAASFLPVSHAVFGVTHLAALCRLLPERDPHPAVYDAVVAILDRMHKRAPISSPRSCRRGGRRAKSPSAAKPHRLLQQHAFAAKTRVFRRYF